jgi:hypothetical protein
LDCAQHLFPEVECTPVGQLLLVQGVGEVTDFIERQGMMC